MLPAKLAWWVGGFFSVDLDVCQKGFGTSHKECNLCLSPSPFFHPTSSINNAVAAQWWHVAKDRHFSGPLSANHIVDTSGHTCRTAAEVNRHKCRGLV